MKIMIASDIHGSAEYCKRLLDAYRREGAEMLALLGDILYHGPRNPLPENYAPQEVAEMLGEIKEEILCVRGNCDSEVDLTVLPFPITPDYAAVFLDGIKIYLSHGHRETPPLTGKDVYITGHTHVPLKENCGYLHLNPGSVSLPKEGSRHGYILYENKRFYFKDLDGSVYDDIEL